MPDIQFTATHLVTVRRPSKWRSAWRFAASALSWVPTYKDTRADRARAKAIRVALLASGLVVFGLVESEARLFGIPLAAMCLVLPISEFRRRSLVTTFKLRQEVEETREESVQVNWDGRRLDVGHEPRLKRILTKPGQFELILDDGLRIASKAGRKAETLVFGPTPGNDVFHAASDDVQRLARALGSVQ